MGSSPPRTRVHRPDAARGELRREPHRIGGLARWPSTGRVISSMARCDHALPPDRTSPARGVKTWPRPADGWSMGGQCAPRSRSKRPCDVKGVDGGRVPGELRCRARVPAGRPQALRGGLGTLPGAPGHRRRRARVRLADRVRAGAGAGRPRGDAVHGRGLRADQARQVHAAERADRPRGVVDARHAGDGRAGVRQLRRPAAGHGALRRRRAQARRRRGRRPVHLPEAQRRTTSSA